MPEDPPRKRQVAYKARVSHLLEGEYVKNEGWEPSYILDTFGRKLSRINLLGTQVSEMTEEGISRHFYVDDGSGKIQVRVFEDTNTSAPLSIGNILLIIGKVRKYQEEIYIIPEIIKRVDDERWVKVRQKELELIEQATPISSPQEPTEEQPSEETKPAAEESVEPVKEEQETEDEAPSEKVYRLIKERDAGQGADMQEIIDEVSGANAENIISTLLKEGEIFEISPGKLKVLE